MDELRLITETGVSFTLRPVTSTVGRPDRQSGWTPTIDLTAIDPNRKTSRRHAEIRVAADGVFVKDLGAPNRTFLNGQPLTANSEYPVNDGDELAFADVRLRLSGRAAPLQALRCPRCGAGVSDDMAICASCGANLSSATQGVVLGAASSCYRCGRRTRGEEHCEECTAAIAEADRELLVLSGLKRKKG